MANGTRAHCGYTTNRSLSAGFLQGVGLALLAVFPVMAAAQQSETSVACDEGTIPEPVAMSYGDSTVNCSIAPSPSESDRFFFSGIAGDTARLRLVTLTNNLDPFVDIRDSANMSIGTFSCTAGSVSRCSTGLTFELPNSGDYLIIVSDIGADNTGGYLLDLERIKPPPVSVPVGYDQPLSDSIGPSTDTDFFQFEATAGTSIRINAVTLTNNLDLRFQLFDPSGNLIVNSIGDGAGCNAGSVSRCSFAVNVTPMESGTYSLQFFDDDAFNSGGYQLSLWCLFGDCTDAPIPDPDGPELFYVPTTDDAINQLADGDFFSFNGTVGTQIILRGITLSNDLDPRIQVRDPNGDVVVSGVGAGAGCDAGSVSRCAFGFSLTPALSGTYSVLVYDNDSFNTGGYRISLFCVLGDCDSDGDGFRDGDREVLSYDVTVANNAVSPSSEGDFYQFQGTTGDEIRITVTGQTNGFDPTIWVYDPNGTRIAAGIADGAGCTAGSVSQCSFSKILFPDPTGVYSMMIFDDDGFNAGQYDITLECIFGTGPGFTCDDLAMPPVLCADNCSIVDNVPQRDTDADGFGNFCDPDLDNSGEVNAIDLGLFKSVFFTTDPNADFDGNGIVNVVDLGILKTLFFNSPGPSCAVPNAP